MRVRVASPSSENVSASARAPSRLTSVRRTRCTRGASANDTASRRARRTYARLFICRDVTAWQGGCQVDRPSVVERFLLAEAAVSACLRLRRDSAQVGLGGAAGLEAYGAGVFLQEAPQV